MNLRSFVSIILCLIVAGLASADRVVFNMIPDALSADDMTPDGRFIVGWTDSNSDGLPDGIYRLDRASDDFKNLPAPGMSAVGVSDDGQFIVGDIPDPTGVGTNVAGRWSDATGWENLGHLQNAGSCPSRSDSYEISADGSTVVGLSFINGCAASGFIWTEAEGMLELENLANGTNRASVVSGDGSVIGGFAQGSFSRTPAVWSNDTSGELLFPPNGDAIGEVHGIRDDGSVLLGNSSANDQPSQQAAKWVDTPTGWVREQIANGSLLPGWSGTPMDIADDDTIVGFDILLGNRRGWIQPEGEGPLIDLRNYFVANGADVPNGLIIEVPQAITTNGRVIVGHGFGTGAWMATILSDCDFDGDQNCDVQDIDLLVTAIVSGDDDSKFDLNDDGAIDLADQAAWLIQAGAENLPSGNAYLLADANLDGTVDGTDFITWNTNKFTSTGKWSLADFNADGTSDGSDFILWNTNKFTSSDIIGVPEPCSFGLIVLPLFLCGLARRHHLNLRKVSTL